MTGFLGLTGFLGPAAWGMAVVFGILYWILPMSSKTGDVKFRGNLGPKDKDYGWLG